MRRSVRPSSGSACVRIVSRMPSCVQQQAAVFPIAEVQRDEQRAASALPGGADDFQFARIGQPVLHRHAAFDAP